MDNLIMLPSLVVATMDCDDSFHWTTEPNPSKIALIGTMVLPPMTRGGTSNLIGAPSIVTTIAPVLAWAVRENRKTAPKHMAAARTAARALFIMADLYITLNTPPVKV